MPQSSETWTRRPFTRKEMQELFKIDPIKHDKTEIERRIRAAEYPDTQGAFIMVDNYKFYAPYEDRKPIVE